MTSPLNPQLELLENSPEVKSFVYQSIADFEPFVTPQTIVAVVSKDPTELAVQFETEGKEVPENLHEYFRISITLSEGGASVEAEGVHRDIYEAIKLAKNNLLNELITIQDSVVSQQDRLSEINHYLQHHILH